MIQTPKGRFTVSPNTEGVLWMLLSGFLFCLMTAEVRQVTLSLDPLQVAFLRYSAGAVLLVPFFIKRWRVTLPYSRKLHVHAFRGILHGIGVMLWFYSLSRVPMAEVQALGFLTPVFVVVGAVLVLGERLRPARILAVALGLAGALIVLRPGLGIIDAGSIAMVVAAPLFAVSELSAAKLSREESPANIVFFQHLFVSLTCVPGAIWAWAAISTGQLVSTIVSAAFATLGHLAWIQALKVADVSATQPIKFLQLVWAAGFGYFMFAEVPDLFTLIGGAVIFFGASLTVYERRG